MISVHVEFSLKKMICEKKMICGLICKMKTDSQILKTCDYQRGKVWGRNSLGAWDGHIPTTIHKVDNQQEATRQQREHCSVFYSNLYGKRIEEWIYVYMCVYVYIYIHCNKIF